MAAALEIERTTARLTHPLVSSSGYPTDTEYATEVTYHIGFLVLLVQGSNPGRGSCATGLSFGKGSLASSGAINLLVDVLLNSGWNRLDGE